MSTYRGVKEELGHILTHFFVALIRVFFCMFVEVLAGSGIGRTGSRVLPTVAVAAGVVNVGVLEIEGTGTRVLLMVVAAVMVNIGALGIGRTGSGVLLMVADTALVNIGALGIGETSRVLLTVAVAAAIVNVEAVGLLALVIVVATVGMGETSSGALLALVIAAATVGKRETGSGAEVAGLGIAREAAVWSGVLVTRFKELIIN